MTRILTIAALVLPLGACVNRDQADARLARGCAAAVELFLPEGIKIKEIKGRTFGASEQGPDFRQVTLSAVESDGWADVDKEYRCVFQEQFGFLGNGHTAAIEQVRANDNVYGKENGQILGTFEEHLKLTEIVEKALNAPGP